MTPMIRWLSWTISYQKRGPVGTTSLYWTSAQSCALHDPHGVRTASPRRIVRIIRRGEIHESSSKDPRIYIEVGRSMTMEAEYTVVDLFCGGGGFSEGFRQAEEFDIACAVDVDAAAVQTYELNAPESTEVLQRDLIELEPEELPEEVDVLIGSPPCKQFSYSNNGGNGDIQEGMELVDRFLYFVHELDPDYWVMENVPRLGDYLPECRGGGDEGNPWLDDGEAVHVERSDILNSEDFGTPQRRRRLFSGSYPNPIEAEKEPLSLGAIRRSFPRPTSRPDPSGIVDDPIEEYDIRLQHEDLTDHFYNSHLTRREKKEIEVLKEDHSYYGPMSFPDEKDVPSRTVVAMNRRIARETLVLEEENPPSEAPDLSRYRKPTLRELATIQGFPITYQFTGTTMAQKRRRIGDAVPPTVSYRIALGILQAEGHDISGAEPVVSEVTPAIEYDFSDRDTTPRKRRKLTFSRTFRHHVPYDDMREFRVDLETSGNTTEHPLSSLVESDWNHPVEFQVVFYRGYASSVEKERVSFDRTWQYLEQFCTQYDEGERVRKFLCTLVNRMGDEIPDASTLQANRSRRMDWNDPVEYRLLEQIAAKDPDDTGVVDEFFPRDIYGEMTIDLDILDGTQVPVRLLMKMVGAHYMAHKLNYCSRWICDHHDRVFFPEDVGLEPEELPDEWSCISSPPAHGCIEDTFELIVNQGWASKEALDPEFAD